MDLKRLLAKIASTGVAAAALLSGQGQSANAADQAVENIEGGGTPVTVTSEFPGTRPLILSPSTAGENDSGTHLQHRSHSSHRSHRSHASHRSHYSAAF